MIISRVDTTELNEIQKIRLRTGFSQAQFCKYFGIPKSTLTNWEAGYSNPSPYIIALLNRVLDYETKYGLLEQYDKGLTPIELEKNENIIITG